MSVGPLLVLALVACLLGATWLYLRSRRLGPEAPSSIVARTRGAAVRLLLTALGLLMALVFVAGASVVTFLTSFAVVTAIAFVLMSPMILVARRRSQTPPVRKFLTAALAVGLLAGTMSANSERLVEQCQKAIFHGDCVDYGTAGMRLLLLSGFGFAALLKAYWLYKD